MLRHGIFLYLGNVENFVNHFRNAPVGGHTCLTAGEQGEPAEGMYRLINLSVPVGGPTAIGEVISYLELVLSLWVLLRGPIEKYCWYLIRRFTAFTRV